MSGKKAIFVMLLVVFIILGGVGLNSFVQDCRLAISVERVDSFNID